MKGELIVKKVKGLVAISMFVITITVLGIVINQKLKEQNDNVERNNDIFGTLQVDIENEVKDGLYRFGGLSEIELKKIPEGVKEIDIAPFEELAKKYEKKELYSEDFQVEYEGLTITKDTTEEEIVDYLGFPENFENCNGGYISSGNGYRRWSLCYPNQSGWNGEQEESHRYLRIVILSQGGGYYSDETWVEPISSYLVFIELEHNVETSRGIKRGDSIENIFEAYGIPDVIQDYEPSKSPDDNHAELIYMGDDISLHFVISENTMTIEYIFIDINREKSIIDQGL